MTRSTTPTIPESDPELLARAEELANHAPVPARAGNVLTGTAGWTDKTLLESGKFYPKASLPARERLEFYARHFSLVEVDATYYTLLPPEVAERWAAWTPEGFELDVKAHPVLTGHPIDVRKLPGDLRDAVREATGSERRTYADRLPGALRETLEHRFFDTVESLARAGKLGCVMLQFPPWFTATRGNARSIERLRDRWADVPMSVELRHASWTAPERRERLFDLLTRLGMAYVCVDEPDVETGGVAPVTRVTHPDLALVRFHGHNVSGWSKKGATVHERFDYVYGPEELAAWVAPVRELAANARRVHAIFNNCVRHYAVINAKGLAVLLEAPEGRGSSR